MSDETRCGGDDRYTWTASPASGVDPRNGETWHALRVWYRVLGSGRDGFAVVTMRGGGVLSDAAIIRAIEEFEALRARRPAT